jgi:hypothetical protein
MIVGRRMNDLRSIGLAMQLQAWGALTSDDYEGALKFAETGMINACAPFDREAARCAKIAALVLLRRPGAFGILRDFMDQCAICGWGYMLTGTDGIWGVALVFQGEIGRGIRWMEQSILRREHDGYRAAADWCRMNLCEIYLEIISGNQRPSAKVLLRNLMPLVAITFTAQRRIATLVERVRQNPQFDPDGHHIARCEMILGLLYKAKKKRILAVKHLTEAKRITSQLGPTPMRAKIEAALEEVAW